jgi:hypothetical protein
MSAKRHAGALIGYGRVSTSDQSADLQVDALQQAGCIRLFIDQASGTLDHRPELDRLLDQLRPGDVVVVWRLDRLGRSLRNLIEIVRLLEDKLLKPTRGFEPRTPSLREASLGFGRFRCSWIQARIQRFAARKFRPVSVGWVAPTVAPWSTTTLGS